MIASYSPLSCLYGIRQTSRELKNTYILIFPLTVDSLDARGHDHSYGVQRDFPGEFAHAVSHFKGAVK
jgi:hypothetical protein